MSFLLRPPPDSCDALFPLFLDFALAVTTPSAASASAPPPRPLEMAKGNKEKRHGAASLSLWLPTPTPDAKMPATASSSAAAEAAAEADEEPEPRARTPGKRRNDRAEKVRAAICSSGPRSCALMGSRRAAQPCWATRKPRGAVTQQRPATASRTDRSKHACRAQSSSSLSRASLRAADPGPLAAAPTRSPSAASASLVAKTAVY